MHAMTVQMQSCVRFAVLCGIPFLTHHTAFAQQDVQDVPSEKYQLKDTPLHYHVIGDQAAKPPAEGFKLLVVLPGGDGSDDFLPFVKRISKHALDDDYLVIQLVSHSWTRNQKIVWPTRKNRVARMKLPTEEFLKRAVEEVSGRVKVDERNRFALGWSSGGPAVYAASLTKETPLTGSFVAMSVFRPRFLPSLKRAKSQAYYVFHSRDDRVCPYRMAQAAEGQLGEEGAKVKLTTYQGGHGWRGNVFGNIKQGMQWLEEQANERSDEASKSGASK